MGSRHSPQRVVRLAGDRGEKRLVRLHKAGTVLVRACVKCYFMFTCVCMYVCMYGVYHAYRYMLCTCMCVSVCVHVYVLNVYPQVYGHACVNV